jgi:hypothetical protein
MRRIIAALMLASILGEFAPFSPMPRASAQMTNQGPTLGPVIQGEVTQKFRDAQGTYRIAVDGTPYEVSLGFFNQVDQGTIVQFDGTNWTVVSGGI